ncbi:MAG: S1 RNA-binding domain-containing protein, partial [Ruminococcus sp.]|nr:S1 RNA-binding domain-containing protein [Ruminococcus sp.]
VFVDLGGVDGLVRKLDLSWKRIKHPSDVVSIGDKIEVKIKDIDAETGKVSLTYKKESENPWEIFKNNYEIGQTVTVKVVSLTSFGAFAQIIDGIDGLIHISQIADRRVDNVADVLSVGDEVDVKITDIDYDKKRISLSIRALLPADGEAYDDADEGIED